VEHALKNADYLVQIGRDSTMAGAMITTGTQRLFRRTNRRRWVPIIAAGPVPDVSAFVAGGAASVQAGRD